MKYKINSLKELNSELIKTLNENDVIEIVNEEIKINEMIRFIINGLVTKMRIVIKYKDLEMKKDEYFVNSIIVKDKKWSM